MLDECFKGKMIFVFTVSSKYVVLPPSASLHIYFTSICSFCRCMTTK